MNLSKINVFLLLVLFASCKEKDDCIYTEEEHKAKLNSKIKHSIYQGEKDKEWIYYDESDSNGRGNCYIFKDHILDGFTFHYSKDTPCYMERSNGNGIFSQITTKPLLDYYFCENYKNQIHLYLNFTLIKNKINEVRIRNEEGKNKLLHIYKDSSKTNEYYCKVYLSEHDSNSIVKTKYFLEYKCEDCKGKISTFKDTIKVYL